MPQSIVDQTFTGTAPDLVGAAVSGCRFEDVDFRDADLTAADFSRCVFERSSFASATLDEACFRNCRFFAEDEGCTFTFARLRETRFEDSDLTLGDFSRCRAYGLELVRCQGQGMILRQADFRLSEGVTGTHTRATLTDCNLAYADLSGCDLSHAVVTGSRLAHAVLTHTNLTGADLSGADLNSIDAEGLILRDADLRGASFNNLNLKALDLTGARVDLPEALALLAYLGVQVSAG